MVLVNRQKVFFKKKIREKIAIKNAYAALLSVKDFSENVKKNESIFEMNSNFCLNI